MNQAGRRVKPIIKMESEMVLKMHGMNTARNRLRNITKTEKRMDFGLNGIKMV